MQPRVSYNSVLNNETEKLWILHFLAYPVIFEVTLTHFVFSCSERKGLDGLRCRPSSSVYAPNFNHIISPWSQAREVEIAFNA